MNTLTQNYSRQPAVTTSTGGTFTSASSTWHPTQARNMYLGGLIFATVVAGLSSVSKAYGNHVESPTGLATSQSNDSKSLSLFGEPFILEKEDGLTILRHRHWSLIGIGETRAAALEALIAGAREVAPLYVTESDESLTPDAISLKRFLSQHFS